MHRPVVLDCDGLLVDTGAAWERAAARVFATVGHHPAGASVDQLVALHASERNGERDRLAARLTDELVDAVAELARPLPGAAALLRRLAGSPHAIASNAPEAVVRRALAHLDGAADGVDVVALAPPLRPKPAPDLHLEACRRIAAEPAASLAFEDSVIGAKAARAAGLQVVGVGAEPDLAAHVDHHLLDLDDPRVLELLDSAPHPTPSSHKEH
jgi:HAD superfamily hydrolase (TIGR01509 family)